MKSGGNRYNPDMKKMYQLERIYTQGEIADMEKKDDLELRICKMLQEATENEDLSKGFYKDLEFTSVDENYIRSLLDGQKRKKKVFYMKICKIVASVAIFFILAGVMATWISEGSVSAVKGKISQLFIEEDGNLMIRNEGIGNIDLDTEESFVIEDWDNVKLVKEKYSDLCIPQYIPKGFNFESFIFEKNKQNDGLMEYKFKGDRGILTIKQNSVDLDEASVFIKNYEKVLKVNNADVYISEGTLDNIKVASFTKNNNNVIVTGSLTETEIIEIIENLE